MKTLKRDGNNWIGHQKKDYPSKRVILYIYSETGALEKGILILKSLFLSPGMCPIEYPYLTLWFSVREFCPPRDKWQNLGAFWSSQLEVGSSTSIWW